MRQTSNIYPTIIYSEGQITYALRSHEAGTPVEDIYRQLGVSPGPVPKASRRHERLSMDFVHDQLFDGRRFRMLTVIDHQ